MIVNSTSIPPIVYNQLNGRQQERYNFHKIAALLADYGFSSIKLDDDWHGADFIAIHINGSTFVKVQLKSRLTFDKKYIGKDIYIAFPDGNDWYFFNHDDLLALLTAHPTLGQYFQSPSWQNGGQYSWPQIPQAMKTFLMPYKL